MKLQKKILYLHLKGVLSPHITQIEECAKTKTERTCDKEELLPFTHRKTLIVIALFIQNLTRIEQKSTFFIQYSD